MPCTCSHTDHANTVPTVCKNLDCNCENYLEVGDNSQDTVTKDHGVSVKTYSISDHQRIIESYDTIYDKIKYLLREIPVFRSLTNKQFVFAFWHYSFGFSPGMVLDTVTYNQLTDPESIRRCKQKVVENHPELQASDEMLYKKDNKQLAIMNWVISR